MAIKMFIAVELDHKELRTYKKEKAKEYFSVSLEEREPWSTNVPARFLGIRLSKSKVVQKVWNARRSKLTDHVKSAKVIRLAQANAILLVHLEILDYQYEEVAKYRKLSSPHLREILRGFELESLLVTSQAIYPVIGTSVSEDEDWLPEIKDGWAHIKGDFVETKLLEEIVARVAIERSLLGWAMRSTDRLRAPIGLWLVRNWPVQLLTDWWSISKQYALLRESLNFPSVRAEVIENGKYWWTTVASITGLIALVVALLGLYL